MISVGLTGGFGCGKSTVAKALVDRGAVLIDADAITKQLQEPGMPVFEAMVARFGTGIIASDGRLDRVAVAGIVFSDEQALKDLNKIVHPRVGETIAARIAERAGTDAVVILDIPLLAEGAKRTTASVKAGSNNSRQRYEVQAVLVVDCPVDTAVERLVQFRGFDETDALARVAKQASRRERRALADFVVDNGGPESALGSQIDAVWTWLSSLEHDVVGPASNNEAES